MTDARLLKSRSEAKELLEQLRAKGTEIRLAAENVASEEQYRQWDEERHRWVKLTEEALKTIFSEEEPVREFEVGARPVMVLQATVNMELGYRRDAMDAAINTLTSLEERLEFMDAPPSDPPEGTPVDLSDAQVFVVHGHDDRLKERVARLLEKTGSHKVTILHEQANEGKTLIEKFEEHAAEVGFAVVLLTADDEGGVAGSGETQPRARQNVVFELGFFFGAARRQKVAVLYEAGVEFPSDISGIAYIPVDETERWEFELLRELHAAGLHFDLNKLA